jgi:hypothetical protein
MVEPMSLAPIAYEASVAPVIKTQLNPSASHRRQV